MLIRLRRAVLILEALSFSGNCPLALSDGEAAAEAKPVLQWNSAEIVYRWQFHFGSEIHLQIKLSNFNVMTVLTRHVSVKTSETFILTVLSNPKKKKKKIIDSAYSWYVIVTFHVQMLRFWARMKVHLSKNIHYTESDRFPCHVKSAYSIVFASICVLAIYVQPQKAASLQRS